MRQLGLYLLSFLFVIAGIYHFVNPAYYLKVMPPYLPAPEVLNWIAGAAEVFFALLLLHPVTRPYGAWGLIALLVAVFPANVYMYMERHTIFTNLYPWALALRLPLQGVLIYWVYQYV